MSSDPLVDHFIHLIEKADKYDVSFANATLEENIYAGKEVSILFPTQNEATAAELLQDAGYIYAFTKKYETESPGQFSFVLSKKGADRLLLEFL